MNTPRILATTIASLALAVPAFAVTDTWDGGGADNNFSTGLNWLDNTAPASDLVNTDLIFAGAVDPTPNVNAVFSANSITFDNTAAPFLIGGSTLTIGTGGIVNNDASVQTFNNAVALGTATSTFNAASGALVFSSVALGTNALTFTGTAAGTNSIATITGSGSLTRINGNLSYGGVGAVTQAWDLVANSGAQVNLNATTDLTVNTTGSITVSGAIFTANGNVTMDATPFLLSGAGSGFGVAGGKTLTLQNGASLSSTSIGIGHFSAGTVTATGAGTVINAGTNSLSVAGSGSAMNVLAGADATFGNFIVGNVGTSTVLFDGVGTTASGSNNATIGNSGTAVVTFSNGATGAFGGWLLATTALSNSQVSVQSGATVTATSLTMVDDAVATESGTLTVNGAGSAFTISGAGAAAIGAASLSSATVAVQNSGTYNTGTGATTVNATGTISITGGTFNANGNLTLNGGDLTRDNTGVLTIASGRTLTVQAGGTASILSTQSFLGSNLTVTGAGSAFTTNTGNININSGSTVQVTAGGHLDSGNSLNIGNAGPGTHTVTVDGAGSELSSVSGGTWGASGGVVNATFSNGAFGSFGGSLQLGNHVNPASACTVLVQSGADLTSTQLLVGNTAGGGGAVTVTGAGSTWTISGGNFLGVGAASGSAASLTVANGGVFNSGTGNSVFNATGTLAINGGTFVANGGMNVNGGQFTRDAVGTFTLPASRALIVQAGGDAIFTGSYSNPAGTSITVQGAGSTFSTTSFLNLVGTVAVSSGGSISSGASIVTVGNNDDGTATVTGVGSSFTGGNLTVGQFGNGSLTFNGGSTGGFGTITVDDQIGVAGSGTLLVQGGATVTGTGLSISPNTATSNGVVAVLGAGSALTLTGAATTSVGASSASAGLLEALDGGTFTSGTGQVTLNATGTIHVDGGTVNLLGPLVRNGGVVDFDAGSLSIISNWNVGAGGLLGTNVTFDASRQMTTTATTTIDAFRTLTLNGGSLTTGALVNNGTLALNSGTLAITGAGGLNIGTGALGSNVTLGAGANLQVTNTATVAAGATLTLTGGAFTAGTLNNSGTIRANLGTAVANSATNNSGGRIFIAEVLNVTGTLTNASGARITLEDGASLLAGAGGLSNSGLVTGDGTIAKPLTNGATGEVRGELGRTLSFTAAATNSGQFNLLGGTLDFASTLTNNATGFISGRGALFTAGLTNNGQMAFAGGNTDIRGDVTLTAGSRVATSGAGSVTAFYDDVTHNGLEIFTGANASTVFYGDQTGAGSFTGTGTVYFIGDLRPGNSPAEVSYGGDLVFGGAASLTLEIGGLIAGDEYDHLDIAGALYADGLLEVALLNGFTPQLGDSFDLFDAGEFAGSFDAIAAPALPGGLEWDFSALKTTGAVAVVPEPSAAVLALLGAAVVMRRRRRPAAQ